VDIAGPPSLVVGVGGKLTTKVVSLLGIISGARGVDVFLGLPLSVFVGLIGFVGRTVLAGLLVAYNGISIKLLARGLTLQALPYNTNNINK
jgi:hypothetical protein